MAAWLSCIFHAFLCLHAWPAAPDWQQHDTGRPDDPRESTHRGELATQKLHTEINTTDRLHHTPTYYTKTDSPCKTPISKEGKQFQAHFKQCSLISIHLSKAGRGLTFQMRASKVILTGRMRERPLLRLLNVKQMTSAWYAGNIPDVWLLMGGKWKSIFTFHPPRHPIISNCFYQDTFEWNTPEPHISYVFNITIQMHKD